MNYSNTQASISGAPGEKRYHLYEENRMSLYSVPYNLLLIMRSPIRGCQEKKNNLRGFLEDRRF